MNNNINESDFELFRQSAAFSMEEICREIFAENRERIRIKKEEVAVKNLVKIFNATLSLSLKKGFHATSLRDLSRESGISMGGLYAYFTGKEMLLDIILQQGRRMVKKMLDEAIGKERSLWGKIAIALRTHIYLSEVLHEWFFFSFMEAKNLSKEQQKAAIASELYTEKIFIDLLEEGKKKGEFSIKNTVLLSSAIKAMLQDWYLKRWKYQRRGISVEAYANFVIESIGTLIYGAKGVVEKE